ncbi:MAP/microtubule affinity-regulating kinase 3-like isoform X9 [Astyanax mexicanus]|uniref:MAP/microtubule affinity-regulating kinase 3-like isoform X9 n=1 Tax=Astyanax mexicanus TaxID=7994 RepID=UPI0020CB25C4|nr:MAP/microtubule affinity-regulating kinase 3-like isoform X9 [Astyanax mexicanus]
MNPKIILSLLGFKVVSFLGEGSYGKVYLASSERYLNNVAIKVMDRSKMSPTAEKFLTRELEIIKYLDHPYIVQVNEVHETPQGLIFIVMEAAMMDLRQMIVELNYFPVDLAKAVFSQLVSAVVYLHEQDIVHRDLKSENILLTPDGTIKVTDFGFGRMSRGFPELCTSLCGTPNYCAPEVLCGKSYDGKKSDVWSLGVILYTMVTGELPFNYENILYLQKKTLQYSIPVEKSCRDFISYMLQYDPFTRPSVTEVAQHPWLQLKSATATTASKSDREVSLKDIDSVKLEKDDSWSSGTTMHSISRIVSPVQPREDDSWSSGTTMHSITRVVSPVQPRGDDSWSSSTTMHSITRIVSPVQPREDDSWSSGSSMDSINRIVSPVQPREDDSWSSGSSMDSINRIASPVQPREDDSWSSGSSMDSINRIASPVQPREDDSWSSGSSMDSINRIVSPVQPREDDSWSSGSSMHSITRIVSPVQPRGDDSWSSSTTMHSITRIVSPVQPREDDSWSSGSSMDSISKIISPVQPRGDDSWSSSTTMHSITRIVSPVQPREDDSWSSGSSMDSFSRIVSPVQPREDDSWSSGSSMDSVSRIVSPVHPRKDDSWSSGTTMHSITRIVSPVQPREDDSWSSGTTMHSIRVEAAANLTCPSVEEVEEEEEFGCFGPHSTRLKGAAKALAKAVAPVLKASRSLQGRIKKFFRRRR